jgi:carboxypeptidase C (cathepsin A)
MAPNGMLIFLSLLTLQFSSSQFVTPPKYSQTVASPTNPNITVSFSEPLAGTCVTTFNTQKQYTGYITIPPYTLAPIQQNYSINTFFWFVEARANSDSSPLTVFMNGGPGMKPNREPLKQFTKD